MKPKIFTDTNHDTMLNLDCDCGVCFLNTLEAIIVKNVMDPKNQLQLTSGLLGGFIECIENLVIIG